MDKDKRVSGPMRNERCGDNGFAEGGRCGEHAVVVSKESVEGLRLRPSQFPLERRAIPRTLTTEPGDPSIAFWFIFGASAPFRPGRPGDLYLQDGQPLRRAVLTSVASRFLN